MAPFQEYLVLALVLLSVFTLFWYQPIHIDQSLKKWNRRLGSQSSNADLLQVAVPKPKHRGAKFNFSASRISAGRNATRFSTVPLTPPSPPTSSSCLLPGVDHKILLFVDYQFFTHFLNWLAHFIDVCGSPYLHRLEVICMDQLVVEKIDGDTRVHCSDNSFLLTNETFHLRHQIVWRHRMSVIVQNLQQNISLLLCDLDALWRHDPYPDMRRYIANEHNIIASRGLWPQTLSDRWGATLCMGFIFIRPTHFSMSLMQSVLKLMEETIPDDQQAINTILYRWNISWSQPYLPLLKNPYPDFGYVPFDNSNQSIALLPHDFYMRNCSQRKSRAISPLLSHKIRVQIKSVTVAHCVAAPGNSYKKFLHLQYMGMWHGGVPEPLRNETLAVIPQDVSLRRVRRVNVYNNSSNMMDHILKKLGLTVHSPLRKHLPKVGEMYNESSSMLVPTEPVASESATQALIRLHKQKQEKSNANPEGGLSLIQKIQQKHEKSRQDRKIGKLAAPK